jgi:hypothetical protein
MVVGTCLSVLEQGRQLGLVRLKALNGFQGGEKGKRTREV